VTWLPTRCLRCLQHDWPGNVRELYHTLERAYLLGGAGSLPSCWSWSRRSRLAHPRRDVVQRAARGGFQAAMQYAEKQLLLNALEACGGNKTAAAVSLA